MLANYTLDNSNTDLQDSRLMIQHSTGYVGIGSTNPTYPLQVFGKTDAADYDQKGVRISGTYSSDYSNDYEGITLQMDRQDSGTGYIKGLMELRHDSWNYDADAGVPVYESASAFTFRVNGETGIQNRLNPMLAITSHGVGINTATLVTGSIFKTYGGKVEIDAGTSPLIYNSNNRVIFRYHHLVNQIL